MAEGARDTSDGFEREACAGGVLRPRPPAPVVLSDAAEGEWHGHRAVSLRQVFECVTESLWV